MTNIEDSFNFLLADANKKWNSLDITSDFIFGKVMQQPDLCKQLIECILNISVDYISYPEIQKVINPALDAKGVRFDVFVKDQKGSVFNIEMQSVDKDHLPKRSRYYQSMIDLNMIEKGASYSDLGNSFVIFICSFDLFHHNQTIYTFSNLCHEVPGLPLNDETVKIFINAQGNSQNINPTLKAFLHYICNGETSNNSFVKQVDDAVQRAKQNKEWRREYMFLYMRDKENQEMGALLKSISQVRKKIAKNLSVDEIAEIFEEDRTYIQRLVYLLEENPEKNDEELYTIYYNNHYNKR